MKKGNDVLFAPLYSEIDLLWIFLSSNSRVYVRVSDLFKASTHLVSMIALVPVRKSSVDTSNAMKCMLIRLCSNRAKHGHNIYNVWVCVCVYFAHYYYPVNFVRVLIQGLVKGLNEVSYYKTILEC